MIAKEYKLLKFIEKNSSLVIPVYQRNYSWKESHCKMLLEDIFNIHEYKLRNYFLGSVVIVSTEDDETLIIDGQQRLTSISLMLFAMYKLLKDPKATNIKNDVLAKEIREKYLVNESDSTLIRLKQVNQDSTSYENLILEKDYHRDNNSQESKDSIYDNYKIFKNEVKDFCRDHRTIDDLWACFDKLEIVRIILQPHGTDDDPQLVFETINYKGAKLEDADLIRNYILMRQQKKIQEQWYDQYWKKIEENTRVNNEEETTEAIKYYLMWKNKKYIGNKEVYASFKDMIQIIKRNAREQDKDVKKELESLLQQIVLFTKYYYWLSVPCNKYHKLEKQLADLRLLEQKTTYSYLMDVIYKFDHQQKIDEKTICEVIKFIINYHIRRFSVGFESRAYNKRFPLIADGIDKIDNTDCYLVKLYKFFDKYKSDSDKYPSDKYISDRMPEQDIYKPIPQCRFILDSMLSFDEKEFNINKGITIEHIMPQELSPEWEKELGGEWRNIHDTWVNTIGNLTLTAREYNSTYGNALFSEKKPNIKSNLRWNIDLSKHESDVWNADTIRDRSKEMIKEFKKAFPDIPIRNIGYVPFNSFNPTGVTPQSYKLFNEVFDFKSWKSLLDEVHKKCYELDEQVFLKFAQGKSYISEDKNTLIGSFSSAMVVACISDILKEYNAENDLLIRLSDTE